MSKVLLPSIVFGIIVTLLDLFIEIEEDYKIVKLMNNDIISANLLIGGLAGSLGILVYTFIEGQLNLKNIKKTPIHDAIGVLIGVIFVIIIYKQYKTKETTEPL
jgi:hypothetical protein